MAKFNRKNNSDKTSVQENKEITPVIENPTPVVADTPEADQVSQTASTPFTRKFELQKNIVMGEESKQSIEEMVVQNHGEIVASNPHIQYVIQVLSEYVEKMSPKAAIGEKSGAELQGRMARMFDATLIQGPELSQIALTIIVEVIKQNLTLAFDQRYAFRFANAVRLNEREARRYHSLLSLFITLASGVSKKDLAKRLNVRAIVGYVDARDAKANLSEFIS